MPQNLTGLPLTANIATYILLLLSEAEVAELADALDSGSSKGNLVEVRVLSSAPFSKPTLRKCLSFFSFSLE
jgi:hypothetical protein